MRLTSSPELILPANSRTILVTFLGAVVRRSGGWLPISAAVSLMRDLGLDESTVRTAVFRLKTRGWLTPEVRGVVKGYSLTELAKASFSAGDEFVWHARPPAELDDGWCVVNVSVPESERASRHRLRTRFSSSGFGSMGSGMWIAPARAVDSARQTLSQLGLTDNSAIFVGRYEPGQSLEAIVRRAWDLEGLNAGYEDFVDSYSLIESELRHSSPSGPDGFRMYLEAVDHWRKLPFRDPGLPPELLDSGWRAAEAGELLERLVSHLEPVALSYAESHWG